MVVDPLHLFDCSLITDGAAVVLLASAERARSMPRRVMPVPEGLIPDGPGRLSCGRLLSPSAGPPPRGSARQPQHQPAHQQRVRRPGLLAGQLHPPGVVHRLRQPPGVP